MTHIHGVTVISEPLSAFVHAGTPSTDVMDGPGGDPIHRLVRPALEFASFKTVPKSDIRAPRATAVPIDAAVPAPLDHHAPTLPSLGLGSEARLPALS